MTRKRAPIHPGEILREEFLLPLRMSAHALSQAIRVPATRVNDIVNGKREKPHFRLFRADYPVLALLTPSCFSRTVAEQSVGGRRSVLVASLGSS